MGRCCAISGCKSGRKATENFKKVSLFKAPKDTKMLKQWSTALNLELKSTSFICELHFNTEDVIKTNRKLLKDGSIYIYEYQNVHLKKKALPQLKTKIDENENIDILLSDNIRPNYFDEIITIVDDSSQDVIDTKISDNTVNEIIETSDQNLTNTNIPDRVNAIVIDDNPVEINQSQKFSIDSIEKVLESQPLRKNWCWTIIKNTFISFSYLNSKLELVCHVKIDINLKVTVINAKTNIFVDMDVDISSIDSIWQLLSYLENRFFCSGTGYNDKKCSPNCTGILLPDETYKKKVLEYRCISCRKLRCFMQKRKEKATDYEARWINAKYRLILERRKLNRVIQQNKNLKQELLAFKNQCAAVEEEVLLAKIADLPDLQQKTVRNCLLAAKAKNAKQRLYTIECVKQLLKKKLEASCKKRKKTI